MPATATLRILNETEDRALDTCATCPSLCRWSCPVAEAEARETTSPNRLAILAGMLKTKRIQPEQAGATPYHCSHCMACTQACLHDNDVGLLMSLARSRLLGAQTAPEAVDHVSGQFAVAGNPSGQVLEDALAAAAGAADQLIVAEADEVYWPGCEVLSNDWDAAGDALRAVALSGSRRPSLIPASANCCGLPLFWAGEIDGFRAHAGFFAAQFARASKVIAHDPTCAHAVQVRYRQVGVTFLPQVVTLVEHLAGAWPTAPARDAALAYMDGCVQARGLNETERPRELIHRATGTRPVELSGPTGVSSDCCGGQGLLPEIVSATATSMAQARIDAFRATGAERLLTASPRCRTHLRTVDPSLPVEDLAGWLARR